jgi:excisionase family DNA binding protein
VEGGTKNVKEKTYTTFQTAEICGVQPSSIIQWVKQKKMKAFVTPGGHRRIKQSDLLEFLKQYNFPIPEELKKSQKRLLIVEDDTAIGQLLKKVFENTMSEVTVEWTTDGIGALLALGNNPPDLIILDVVMPMVDGAQVLSTLRLDPITRNIKVIAVTGKRLAPEKMKFVQSYSDAFYLKPFDLNVVVKKAMSLLGVLNQHPNFEKELETQNVPTL